MDARTIRLQLTHSERIQLVEFLREYPIIVEIESFGTLREQARAFHQPTIDRLVQSSRLSPTDLPDGRKFLRRMIMNLLRHDKLMRPSSSIPWQDEFPEASSLYEGILMRGTEILGFDLVYSEINSRLLSDISDHYPMLRNECESQRSEDPLIKIEDIFRRYSSTGTW